MSAADSRRAGHGVRFAGANDLLEALSLANKAALELADELPLYVGRDVDSDVEIATAIANALERARDRTAAHADVEKLALELDRVSVLASYITLPRTTRGGCDGEGLSRIGYLEDYITRASNLASKFGLELDAASGIRSEFGATRVSSSAAGLAAAAARLLPAAYRARFAEEYQSELWELAQAGDGHIRQLRYSVRQLRNALPMGVALRSPRRKSSAP